MGWLIDGVSAKLVLLYVAVGQVIFVFLSASFSDLALFFFMMIAMSFVFGQIPITDAVMSRYVLTAGAADLSIKFLLNLCIGATVLPLSGYMLQTGYQMSDLFSVMSLIACFIFLAGLILLGLCAGHRADNVKLGSVMLFISGLSFLGTHARLCLPLGILVALLLPDMGSR